MHWLSKWIYALIYPAYSILQKWVRCLFLWLQSSSFCYCWALPFYLLQIKALIPFFIGFYCFLHLYLLADFPKDLLLLIFLLLVITRIDKFYLTKKEIILAIFAFLCYCAMLFLPDLSTILLFAGSYSFIYLTHDLLVPFVQKCEKRYEKYISLALLAVLVARCVYRALLIINAYPI